MYIQQISAEKQTNEYGIVMQRLFQVATPPLNTPFGSAWGFIEPANSSEPHQHHEHEVFILMEGKGTVLIEDEVNNVVKGDTIYIPPFSNHILKNDSDDTLVFLTIWWE
jgi:methionyl-tRNA synthetase